MILILGSCNKGGDESLGDSLHEGQLSALRVFGGSVTGFKAQKLRLMPSSLEADEVKGFSFARRVIWMQLSDRVARGRIRLFSCSRCIDTYIFRKFILVLLEQCTTGRTSGTMHWDLLDIHTLQTLCSGGG